MKIASIKPFLFDREQKILNLKSIKAINEYRNKFKKDISEHKIYLNASDYIHILNCLIQREISLYSEIDAIKKQIEKLQ